MDIIIKPVLTEKMTIQGEKLNRYGFIVDLANTADLGNAVEQMYNNVVVTDANTVKLHGQTQELHQGGPLSGRANNFQEGGSSP